MKHHQKFIRAGIFKIEEVLPFITKYKSKKEYIGKSVKMGSLRYHTFAKSLKCIECGIEGKYFALEKSAYDDETSNAYHFNLYALTDKGEEIMMTKDHIVPTSKGGTNYIDNLQTMCAVCNFEKASNREE